MGSSGWLVHASMQYADFLTGLICNHRKLQPEIVGNIGLSGTYLINTFNIVIYNMAVVADLCMLLCSVQAS